MTLTAVSKPQQWLTRMARPKRPLGGLLWPASIGLLLLLWLAVAFVLDGQPLVGGEWRFAFQAPVLAIYTLLAYQLIASGRERLQRSFATLAEGAGQACADGEPGASTSTQVGAVLAALVGLAFVLALDRPWSWDFTTQPWTRGYVIGSRGLLFALVGWVASQALGSTRLPTALARSAASLDAIALLPAARQAANHGLRLALVFAGGVSLSLVFVPLDQLLSPASVLAHGAVIGLTMLIYASALWGVHQVLATAKARELGRVREELASAYGQLKQTDPAAPDLPILSARIAAWTSYERRLLDLPEWVHDAPTLRRLGASILLPAATLGMRLLLDRVR